MISIENFSHQVKPGRGIKFLNHAATNPVTGIAAQAMEKVVRQSTEPMEKHLGDWIGVIEQARRQTAKLLNASPDEIAFVQNTSTGLSLIAHMVPFEKGDVILYDKDDFPSNRLIWECISRRKELSLNTALFSSMPGEDLLEKLTGMDLSRVRLLSLSLVSYHTGYRQDLKTIGEFCREKGIYLCVDAIQAIGALDIDLETLNNISFLACGGQKWLHGPLGSGFIFIRKALLEKINMPMAGWTSVDKAGYFHSEYVKWLDGASRFEAGLPDVAVIAGLGKNVEVYNSIGIEKISRDVLKNSGMIRNACENWAVRLLTPNDPVYASGIVSFEIDSREKAEAIDAVLKEKKIIITRRNNYFRISPHFHTKENHIQQALDIFSHFLEQKTTKGVEKALPDAPISRDHAGSAVVIGASGELGEAVAEELAKRGYTLLLAARDETALHGLSIRLQRLYAVQIEKVKIDLTDRQRIEDLSRLLSSRDWDFFAYTAAAASATKVLDQSEPAEKEAFTVNYFTPVKLARAILPGMVKRNKGRMLFITTSGSRCSTPLFSTYAASKGALWSWAESLSRELKGSSVSCTIGIPPHMNSATQQKLARSALKHFHIKGSERMSSSSRVAKALVDSTVKGKPVSASPGTKIKHALNALFPQFIQNRITTHYES